MNNLEKRALRAGSFIHNNGKVLRTVNILRLKYNKLTGVQSVLEDDGIAEDEFLDSVNFLAEEGYIHLRRISNKEPAALADTDYTALEAKLTGKGIRLLAGGIEDDMPTAFANISLKGHYDDKESLITNPRRTQMDTCKTCQADRHSPFHHW